MNSKTKMAQYVGYLVLDRKRPFRMETICHPCLVVRSRRKKTTGLTTEVSAKVRCADCGGRLPEKEAVS